MPTAPASRATIPERLKSDTAAEHRVLEERLNLLRPGFHQTDYIQLLARFYGFYVPWERAAFPLLRAWRNDLFDASREKAGWLSEDLLYFGVDPSTVPLCPAIPELESIPGAIGSAYVIEGSTLGGQLLTRHFRGTLGLGDQGMTFYQAYGARTGSMWTAFRQAVVEAEDLAPVETFTASARSTFRAISEWLTGKE